MILAAAILVGIAIGLARGGRLQRLASVPLRWGWMALVAFGLQIYLIYFPQQASAEFVSLRLVVLVLSYIFLIAVIWQNRRLPGLWLLAAGLFANLAVMLLNGGYMPITLEALSQAGFAHNAQRTADGVRVLFSKDVVLDRDATVAWWLSDIFVLPPPFPIPSIFSVGDVLVALGGFWFLQKCMRGEQTQVSQNA
jgi:hypothetical protein